MKIHFNRKCILLCIALMLFISDHYRINAEGNNYKAVITCNLPNETNDYFISAEVLVQFVTPSLYNDGVKLSYKIYDTDLNLMLGENERIPLEVTEGTAKVSLDIDINELGIAKGEEIILIFDLVDENNIYWFRDNPFIEFETPQIRIRYDFWYNVRVLYTNIFKQQSIQLAVNIAGFIIFIVCLIKFRKSELFSAME